MAELASAPSGLALSAFSGLEAAGVAYCIWKGSNHLARSLAGDGDLDVLVDESYLTPAQRVLTEHGFVRADRVDPSDQPGLQDWFGLDGAALVHIQLHWQLNVGDLWSGWWRVPREREVLREIRLAAAHRLYISSPAHEAALLLVRASLAARRRDQFVPPLWRRSRKQWSSQWAELRNAATPRQVRAIVREWFGQDLAAAADDPRLELSRLMKGRKELLRRLQREHRSGWRQASRLLPLMVRRLDRRTMRVPMLAKRGLPEAGLCIAIVGRGAAEVADEVARLFAPKFDTNRVRVRTSQPGDRTDRRTASARQRGLLVLVSGGQPTATDRVVDLDDGTGQDRDRQVAAVRGIVWSEIGRRTG